jgi:glutathione S-transferase
MIIYWIKSQAPQRVLALAKHLDIKAEFRELNMMAGELKTAEYAALNPNMKVPTLVDGDKTLWESSAIMAYLCVKAGSKAGADMWPNKTSEEQIEVMRWLAWSDSHWSLAVAPFYFEHIVKSTFGIGPPDTESLTSKTAECVRYAKVLDAHLAGHDYIVCDRLTIVDFHLASMAAYWRESKMPLEDFSHIVSWLDRLMRIPAWSDPWPVVEQKIPAYA